MQLKPRAILQQETGWLIGLELQKRRVKPGTVESAFLCFFPTGALSGLRNLGILWLTPYPFRSRVLCISVGILLYSLAFLHYPQLTCHSSLLLKLPLCLPMRCMISELFINQCHNTYKNLSLMSLLLLFLSPNIWAKRRAGK